MGNKLINIPFNIARNTTFNNRKLTNTINKTINNPFHFTYLSNTVKAFCIKNSNSNTNSENNTKKIQLIAEICQV